MQNTNVQTTTQLNLELFHLQTNTSFELPLNLTVINIGKPNGQINPEIDISYLPDTDIVSRNHARIYIEETSYYIEDTGSSNGTFLNNVKLEQAKRYPLKLGDKIDLGKDSKVTFIFQQKQNIAYSPNKAIARPTVLQPQKLHENAPKTQVDRTSKLIGLALMVVGVILFTANTQLGIFVRIPGVILCVAGIALFMQNRIDRKFGWLLIALGVAVMIFTGNVFASVNLLATLASAALLFAGSQLFTTGKVLKYSLRDLKIGKRE